jgi:hypothetical protein
MCAGKCFGGCFGGCGLLVNALGSLGCGQLGGAALQRKSKRCYVGAMVPEVFSVDRGDRGCNAREFCNIESIGPCVV